jgi:hypothetical protein
MGHAIGNLYQYQESAGLFGDIGTTGVVRNLSVNNAYMTASGMFAGGGGGIIALRNQGLITNTHASGGISSYRGAGGLVAVNDGTIERSSAGAGLNGDGAFGGLARLNNGNIVQSFSISSVRGGSHASGAGLVVDNHGSITQSYAAGAATMYTTAGLVLYNGGTINESFATTHQTPLFPPDQKAGVAFTNAGTIADNVFWDVQATTATNSVYSGKALPAANGLTTAQMSTTASFGPTWDFGPTGTWVIPVGGTHPILRWQQDAQ